MNELADERKAAHAIIESTKVYSPFVFEKMSASPKKAREVFREKVKDCDIFILIIGRELGEYTLEEFDLAQKQKKPTLIFVKEVEDRSKECSDFIKKEVYHVGSVSPSNFKNIKEFKQKLDQSLQDITSIIFRNNLQIIDETPRAVKKILTHIDSTHFIDLNRRSVKSPLELIKEAPESDDVLPVMSGMTNISNIPGQIKFAKEKKYAEIYSDSWAEEEAMLIGYKTLREVEEYVETFNDLYDAGCANCGQYSAFEAVRYLPAKSIPEDFVYYAQDFNPDWNDMFLRRNIPNSEFVEKPLPYIPYHVRKFKLVSCVHVFHYMHKTPLAIYTSIFSFNNLLESDGICYITVPLKDSQPGMLDLLEKSAQDAGFLILNSGKRKVVRRYVEEPYNILSYVYLIIQKKVSMNDRPRYDELLRWSMIRSGCVDSDNRNLPPWILNLESDLKLILEERDSRILTLRKAIIYAGKKWKENLPSENKCIDMIKTKIKDINTELLDSICLRSTDKLVDYCEEYLFWLSSFLLQKYPSDNGCDIMLHITKTTDTLRSNERPRISLENYGEKDNAYLIQHLFDLCQEKHIDIGEKIAREMFSSISI